MAVSKGTAGGTCPLCGNPVHAHGAAATCAVCSMAVDPHRFPHILRIEPDGKAIHFCSVPCMDSYEFLGEGGDDA